MLRTMLKTKLVSIFLIVLTSLDLCQPSSSFLSVPKSAVVTIRANVSLECVVVNSTMSANWDFTNVSDRREKTIFFSGRLVQQMESRYRVNKSLSGQYDLIIDSVDRGHAGRYVCKPFQSETTASAELTVIDSHPVCGVKSTGTVENDTVSMWCEINSTGSQIPEIKWTKGNEAIESVKNVTDASSGSTVKNTRSLVLLKLRPEDNGVTLSSTTSFMWTNGSTANVPAYVHVWNHTLTVHYGVRYITIHSNASNFLIGDQLMCSAEGNPEPAYTWTHLNTSRIQTGSALTLNDSSLSIGSMHVFVCTAENRVAGERKIISRAISLSIGAAPKNITVLPKSSRFRYGDQLTCSADGSPEPKYVWTHDNQTYEGSVLTLPRSLATGPTHVFVCTAENRVSGVRRLAFESIVFAIEEESNDGLFAFDTSILVIIEGIIILLLVFVLIAVALKAGKAQRNASASSSLSSQLRIASDEQTVDRVTERLSKKQAQGAEGDESDIPEPYGSIVGLHCLPSAAMLSETYWELDMFEQEIPKTGSHNSKTDTQGVDVADTYEIMENLARSAAIQPEKYYEFNLLKQKSPKAKSAMSTILDDKKQESPTNNVYQSFAARPATVVQPGTYCELKSKQKKPETSN